MILASGSYGAVKSMLPKEMSNYVFYGLDSETGDGYRMATAIGADTINMDLVKMYPQASRRCRAMVLRPPRARPTR